MMVLAMMTLLMKKILRGETVFFPPGGATLLAGARRVVSTDRARARYDLRDSPFRDDSDDLRDDDSNDSLSVDSSYR